MMRAAPKLLALTLAGASADEFCPSAQDLGFDYNGGSQIYDQGWTIRGGARVHTTNAYNLLGGSLEFDYDVSGGHPGINNNLYTISPDLNGGAYTSMNQYCDGQAPDGKYCMELDVIESNGNCGGATTLHTKQGGGGGCDKGGCQALYHYSGKTKMHVRTEYDNSGVMTTYVNGQKVGGYEQMHPSPGGDDSRIISDTMRRSGVVLMSSQWEGWVPLDDCGKGGDLGSAAFSVSNLRIRGAVVSGPAPRRCSGSSPSPPPPPPGGGGQCPGNQGQCGCSWTQDGANCNTDDSSECWCRCCCEHHGNSCNWHGLEATATDNFTAIAV